MSLHVPTSEALKADGLERWEEDSCI